MQKIPTMFVRDPQNMRLVTREVTPGCEWVLAGEGVATRKFDGTNVQVKVRGGRLEELWKRRNPTRDQKADGAEPDYVQAEPADPSDKWIFAAANATDFTTWPDGDWSCEAVGPKIQGGIDGLPPGLIPFSRKPWVAAKAIGLETRSFDGIRAWLETAEIEGIVFHHPDGRMAKIKSRDFGIRWSGPATIKR